MHDANGRFAKGNPGGPGRQAGEMGQATKEARKMILEALDMVGGAKYLALMAIMQPAPFLNLVGRTLPLKVVADDDPQLVVSTIEYRIIDTAKK